MVGNDIVDKNFTKKLSKWKDERFQKKVFNLHERNVIEESIDPFNAVWRMWSMKESAYKAHVKNGFRTGFYPHELSCSLTDKNYGVVNIAGKQYQTSTIISEAFIYSKASISSNENIHDSIFELSGLQEKEKSNYIHKEVIQLVSHKAGVNKNAIKLNKHKNGVPYIYADKTELTIHFSITHHGNYGAICLIK